MSHIVFTMECIRKISLGSFDHVCENVIVDFNLYIIKNLYTVLTTAQKYYILYSHQFSRIPHRIPQAAASTLLCGSFLGAVPPLSGVLRLFYFSRKTLRRVQLLRLTYRKSRKGGPYYSVNPPAQGSRMQTHFAAPHFYF